MRRAPSGSAASHGRSVRMEARHPRRDASTARAGRRLPRDETAFFGRQAELAEMSRRLGESARLVTLLGLGGIGKTRLALAAASATNHPVSFASLGSARSLEAAVRAVASATGVRLKAELKARA